jgi:hypothetical protein
MTVNESTTTEPGVALTTASARAAMAELEQMREHGLVAIERKRAFAAIEKVIDGCEWGTVKGISLSAATKHALSEVCVVTGANPYIHIDILGGRPYHNAAYWEDLVNQHPHYVDSSQRAITKTVSDMLFRQADQMDAEAATLLADASALESKELREQGIEMRTKAVHTRNEAREVERLRVHYGVPDYAEHAYETSIVRYTPDAPLDAIKHGDIDGTRFLQTISEANWIDTKRTDPVGKSRPDVTARTRSRRRAAKKAFSHWIEPKMQEVERFERAIEAEYRVITSDEHRERLSLGAGDAIASGNGEPTATSAARAQPLPVQDRSSIAMSAGDFMTGVQEAQAAFDASGGDMAAAAAAFHGEPTQASQPAPSPQPAAAADDEQTGDLTDEERQELRKRLFPNLKENGITDEPGRKQWAMDNELPDSTKIWTRADFDEAFRILEGPAQSELLNAVGAHGYETVEEFCTARSLEVPQTLKDVKALTRVVQASR